MAVFSQPQIIFGNICDGDFKEWFHTINMAFMNGGWVQATDTGQFWNYGTAGAITPAAGGFGNASMNAWRVDNTSLASSETNLPDFANNGTTSDGWNANAAPNSTTWFHLIWDHGCTQAGSGTSTGTTQTIQSYKVWFQNTTADAKTWTLEASNDNVVNGRGVVNWTVLDTQSLASLPGSSGFQTYNCTNSTPYRFYRLKFTASFGAALQINEWQLWTGTGGTLTNTVTNSRSRSNSGTNISNVYCIWKMGDTMQGTSPCYIKLEAGIGASVRVPSLWLNIGTGSDGNGNITGTISTSGRVQFDAAAANVFFNTPQRTAFCVASDRFAMALGYFSTTCQMLLAIERLRDLSTNNTVADGFWSYGASYGATTTKLILCGMQSGASPPNTANCPYDTDFQGDGPTNTSITTAQRSGVTGLFGIEPIFFYKYGAMRSFFSYFKNDMSPEYTQTANYLGTTHNVFTLGINSKNFIKGGNTNMLTAIAAD